MKIHCVDLPDSWETARILPISDIHVGDELFDERAFLKLRQWVLDNPDVRVVLNGDLINAATKRSVSDVHAARMTPQEEAEKVVELLMPMRDQIIGATLGNHDERIYRDTGWDAMRSMTRELGVPYDPNGITFKVRVGKNEHSKPFVYTIYVTHGAGSGRGFYNKISKYMIADVIVIGHVHRVMLERDTVLIPDLRNDNWLTVERTFFSCGSFMNWGGYAQRFGYAPGTKDMPLIVLSGRGEKKARVLV